MDNDLPTGDRQMSSDDSEPLIRVMALHALMYCERLILSRRGGGNPRCRRVGIRWS